MSYDYKHDPSERVFYGQLFGPSGRFRKEGCEEEAKEFYERILKDCMEQHRKAGHRYYYNHARRKALELTNKEFPPDLEAQEIWLYHEERRREDAKYEVRKRERNAAKRRRQQKEKKAMENARQIQNEAVEALSEKLNLGSQLPEEVSFAWANMHRIIDVADFSTWKIHPVEAPSAQAWNMLMFACQPNTRKDFMTLVMRYLFDMEKERERQKTAEVKAKQKNTEPEDPMEAEYIKDEGLEEIMRMMVGNQEGRDDAEQNEETGQFHEDVRQQGKSEDT